MKNKTIERRPCPVWRGGRANIQNVYTARDDHGRPVERWVWILDKQHPVFPHPRRRGYIVEVNQQ